MPDMAKLLHLLDHTNQPVMNISEGNGSNTTAESMDQDAGESADKPNDNEISRIQSYMRMYVAFRRAQLIDQNMQISTEKTGVDAIGSSYAVQNLEQGTETSSASS
ncbi:hypothetical protein BT96DRAFT_1006900 [Gymnopus androsaceus JB14]|uniref:Uncharacterized protein n=1 Tax=Gymnopus androsaceus JB14 TaxID=1447944 RepID=A0A6A4GJ25_9AGAR|nr:hypothetical protein BT96DRAFT_1006900 [Gymnopus androsaceus JB14]